MSTDRNFDDLFDRFHQKIKHSKKGLLREVLIREDLQAIVQTLHSPGLEILDAGCGLGDMSLWFAQQGHQVTAIDIAEKMVKQTQDLAQSAGMRDRIKVSQCSLQEALNGETRYDLICIHAVMEWLAKPYDMLHLIPACLKPGAYFSLTVYNIHHSILSSLIKGNFRRVLQSDFAGSHARSLTPPNPIEPERIAEQLHNLGFQVKVQAGLRCFYDFMSPTMREERNWEDLLLLERRYRNQEPYRSSARYVHFIAQFPGDGPIE